MVETTMPAAAAALLAKGRIATGDVLAMRRHIFADGMVSRAEADQLFALHRGCPEQGNEWAAFFVEAVTDYIVHQEKPAGYISDENAEWLVRSVSSDRMVASRAELELLVRVLEVSKCSPPGLSAFALRQVMHAVVDGKGPLMIGGSLVPGLIARSEVALLRRILHAFGGDGNIGITRAEAEILFTINERTSASANDPEWNDLFVKAIANFVMCASGYEAPPRAEALRRDQLFETAEPDITGFFARMFSGGVHGVLRSCRLADDVEADWALRNEAAAARAKIAEAIDDGEARWLADRIGQDGELLENERALLKLIKQSSPSVHPELQPLLDRVA